MKCTLTYLPSFGMRNGADVRLNAFVLFKPSLSSRSIEDFIVLESVCGDPDRRRCVGFRFVELVRFSSSFRLFGSVLLLLLVVPADETAVKVAIVFALIGARGGGGGELVCRGKRLELNLSDVNIED